METCPSVKNILLLDSEGKRVAVKYYTDDWPVLSAKLAFEKSVFVKTQKASSGAEENFVLNMIGAKFLHGFVMQIRQHANISTTHLIQAIKFHLLLSPFTAEIVMFDGQIVVYKFIQDLHFFVTGGDEDNELILASVLQGFADAIDIILRNNVDKRTALENLDLILLCLDEIVDGGIVLETEGSVIAEKVLAHGAEGATSIAEQTIVQALTTAREHFAKSLLM
uniref:Coatomer subunit zeta n=1 Tax=Aegilops tauschii TaxID=37682 RepID=M8BDU7_AEGTA